MWDEASRNVAAKKSAKPSGLGATSTMVGAFEGWSADEIRSIRTPTLIIAGDTNFVRLDHAAEMSELLPHGELAVLPGATRMEVTRRPEQVLSMIGPFLAAR